MPGGPASAGHPGGFSMPKGDVFALQHSSLNAFLFAPVGVELNGSTLTILSMLARLGLDPWVEAAQWARLPRASATAKLAQSIAAMPLSPQAIAGAQATAARLALLLPATGASSTTAQDVRSSAWSMPAWLPRSWWPVAALLLLLLLGVGTDLLLGRHQAFTPVAGDQAPAAPVGKTQPAGATPRQARPPSVRQAARAAGQSGA